MFSIKFITIASLLVFNLPTSGEGVHPVPPLEHPMYTASYYNLSPQRGTVQFGYFLDSRDGDRYFVFFERPEKISIYRGKIESRANLITQKSDVSKLVDSESISSEMLAEFSDIFREELLETRFPRAGDDRYYRDGENVVAFWGALFGSAAQSNALAESKLFTLCSNFLQEKCEEYEKPKGVDAWRSKGGKRKGGQEGSNAKDKD